MDFIIDTAGDEELQEKTELLGGDEKPYFIEKEDRIDAILDLFDRKKDLLDKQEVAEEEVQDKLKNLKIDTLFNDFFKDMKWTDNMVVKKKSKKQRLFHFDQLNLENGKLNSKLGAVDVEKEMEKSVFKPGFEKQHSLPAYDPSDRMLKALRKKEREKTKGPGWFNMRAPEMTDEVKRDLEVLKMRSVMDPKHFYKKNDMEVLPKYFQKEREKTKGPGWFNMRAPEMTDEVKRDLEVLKMRSVMDPKHFYKKNDMEVLPKYFQVGRIMDSSLDHVNDRLTRKQRKRTMVDELLADAEFQKYNKKKYKEIIEDKRKSEYRTHMKDKRHKNKAELKKSKLKSKKKSPN